MFRVESRMVPVEPGVERCLSPRADRGDAQGYSLTPGIRAQLELYIGRIQITTSTTA